MRLFRVYPLVLVAACATTAPPPADAAPALSAADREFDVDTAATGVDGWVAHFAPNGVMLQGEGPAISGTEAIRTAMEGPLASSSLRWQPTESGMVVDGQLGYTVGRYESRRKSADGSEKIGTGTYLTIWKKMADGSWKVVFDTGVADPKPAVP
jgi:ketosteroid isomerase-like protein